MRAAHPETIEKARAISKIIEKELFAFSAMYLALSKRLGRAKAYDFFKTEIVNKIGQHSIPLIYQVADLKQCQGDVFENFKKMNIALFERTTKDGTWIMEDFHDEPDKLTVKVTTCANVDLFTELDVPSSVSSAAIMIWRGIR